METLRELIARNRAARHPSLELYTHTCIGIQERIYKVMQEKKIRQKDLAKELGVSEAAVSKMLSGVQNLELLTIAKLAAALETNLFDAAAKEFPRVASKHGWNTLMISVESEHTKLRWEHPNTKPVEAIGEKPEYVEFIPAA